MAVIELILIQSQIFVLEILWRPDFCISLVPLLQIIGIY